MRRGDLFRVRRPGAGGPKRSRVFVVVSRQALIDSRFSAVVCAPVYPRGDGLATQVDVGPDEGLKHESSIRTGVDLSGGEWQKIVIARAYMRDAQLLIWTSRP